MNNRKKGKYGEELAVKELEKNGFEIIKTNFYTRTGEIDIIAKKEKLLSFVEVKYRTNKNFGFAGEAINKRKKLKIYNTALEFLSLENFSDFDYSFDAILIDGLEITWIENSFWGDEIGL